MEGINRIYYVGNSINLARRLTDFGREYGIEVINFKQEEKVKFNDIPNTVFPDINKGIALIITDNSSIRTLKQAFFFKNREKPVIDEAGIIYVGSKSIGDIIKNDLEPKFGSESKLDSKKYHNEAATVSH